MAIGQILGGIAGGVLGGTAIPGLGAPAGYAIGSAIGGGIEGAIQQKKAEGMELPTVTPLQTSLLNDIRMRRAAMEAGTMYQPQQENIKQIGTQAMRSAVQATGGDTNATISALQKIQRGTGRSLGELYGQMMNQANQTLALENQMATDFANREFRVAEYNKMQAMADAMQKQKDAKQILAAVIAQKLKAQGFSDDDILKKIIEQFPDLYKAESIGTTPKSLPFIMNMGTQPLNTEFPTQLIANTQNPLFRK